MGNQDTAPMKSVSPKGIFFDWDLTLVDSLSGRDALVDVINRRFGVELEKPVLKQLFSMSLWHAIEFLYQTLKPNLSFEMFEAEVKKVTIRINRDLVLHDEKTLRNLKETYKLAIISNNEPDNIEPILKNYAPLFEGLWAGPDHKTVKLQKALDALDLASDEVIYVGDHPHDIEAAQALGITSVGITSPLFTAEELGEHNPDFVIQKLSDLLQYLR